MGSFKIRGAGSLIGSLSDEELAEGVWTASAGNMAQAVAWYASRRGIPATVVMPDTAPFAKRSAAERLGATVIPVTFAEWIGGDLSCGGTRGPFANFATRIVELK